jgi:peptidoglycan/LPS O-acetylase OafA/YrhL
MVVALLFISALALLSFSRQLLSSSNIAHMSLDARVWQFLFGFLAHFTYKAKLLDVTGINRVLRIIVTHFPVASLVVLLLVDASSMINPQMQRLPVILLTAIMISMHSNETWALSSDVMVNFGNASYSIYLVHWPIFTLHRYLDPDKYEDGKEACHIGI